MEDRWTGIKRTEMNPSTESLQHFHIPSGRASIVAVVFLHSASFCTLDGEAFCNLGNNLVNVEFEDSGIDIGGGMRGRGRVQ